MSKITISRLFDTSKTLATEAGKQVADFVNYMALLSEQCLRILRNGISFEDNFSAFVKRVSVTHNTTQAISVDKTPIHVWPTRVFSTSTGIDSFSWYIDSAGQLQIKVGLTGAPTGAVDVQLVICV